MKNSTRFFIAVSLGLALLCAAVLHSQSPTMGGMGYPPVTPNLVGTTASIGGSLLLLGACSTGTATVAGATQSMVAVTSPANAVANGVQFQAFVSSANTVTVQECALLTITPAATAFNVRVIP